ncbi:TPA: hypothetical protein ACY3LS_003261, partial [Klebsiella pneumoniae]
AIPIITYLLFKIVGNKKAKLNKKKSLTAFLARSYLFLLIDLKINRSVKIHKILLFYQKIHFRI